MSKPISPDEDDLYILLYRVGLRPYHLAERLGVTRGAVSKWLTGVKLLPDSRAEEMASVLGRTKEEIIRAYEVGKAKHKGGDTISPGPPSSESGSPRREGQKDPAAPVQSAIAS